ncbi:MAG TPA: hypothetical protein VF920_04290 [Dongiaceae bacterium]
MVDTSITSRALTYRDPTVSAAAEVQLRRNRQQSFERLVDQAQQTTAGSVKLAQVNQDLADRFQAAQEAVDQSKADKTKSSAKRPKDQSLASSTGTGDQQQATGTVEPQAESDQGAPAAHPTATFSTQQISQEQLGIGLHVPPLQPADEAYRRAGAEPPLVTEQAAPLMLAFAI